MGELWIIDSNGILTRSKIDPEKGERHINALKEFISENNLEMMIDDSIYNSGIIMAQNNYCIIGIDSEHIIMFGSQIISDNQRSVLKEYLPLFKNYPFRYIDVAQEIKTYRNDEAITKIYKKIKRK